MKDFADLFSSLDQTNSTNEKVEVLKNYFSKVSEEDKVWTLALFTGRKPKRPVNTTLLTAWSIEAAEIPSWLFEESYHVVGDLAETISLLLPLASGTQDKSLTEWIRFISSLTESPEEVKKIKIINAWNELTQQEKFVFNKLITGSFRVGVSQNLVVKALSELTTIEKTVITHRIMGNWDPNTIEFKDLIHEENELDNVSRPYPFFLAHAVEDVSDRLGEPSEWQAEWKWDGIRSQIIKRQGNFFVWSRGEELVTEKFPEFLEIGKYIPEGTVLDGEILPYAFDRPLSFNVLQTRIGRKNLTQKILKEAPVIFMAYDVMEWEGKDIREKPLLERRILLEKLINKTLSECFKYSPKVEFGSWEELGKLREQSRENHAEGFMIKRKNSSYQVGRKRGDWWKWKINPFSIDGVLVYAQKGHGRRADLYTDYTFAVWNEGTLVPFAKAYSGLTDEEIKKVDSFVRKNTKEKFGPVRTVKPELVFEIAFEGIQKSGRHKSGIALRFPRILRWRTDKKPEAADTLLSLKQLLEKYTF